MRVYAIIIRIAYLCGSDSQSQIENYISPKAAPNALSLSLSYDSQQPQQQQLTPHSHLSSTPPPPSVPLRQHLCLYRKRWSLEIVANLIGFIGDVTTIYDKAKSQSTWKEAGQVSWSHCLPWRTWIKEWGEGGGVHLIGKLQPRINSAHHCKATNQANVNFQLAAQINWIQHTRLLSICCELKGN